MEVARLEADRVQELKRLERLRPTGLVAWIPSWLTGCRIKEEEELNLLRNSALQQWQALESQLVGVVSAAKYRCVLACLEDEKQAMKERQELEREAAVYAMEAARVATAIAAARDEAVRKEKTRVAAALERDRHADSVRAIRVIRKFEKTSIWRRGGRGAKPEQRSISSTSGSIMFDVCRRIGRGFESFIPTLLVVFADVPANVFCEVVDKAGVKWGFYPVVLRASSILPHMPVLLARMLPRVICSYVWRVGACYIDRMYRLGYG